MTPDDPEFSYVADFPPLTEEQLHTIVTLMMPTVRAVRARQAAEKAAAVAGAKARKRGKLRDDPSDEVHTTPTDELPARLITVRELAEHLAVTPATVYNLMKRGLPSLKIGRARRCRIADVEAWLRSSGSE